MYGAINKLNSLKTEVIIVLWCLSVTLINNYEKKKKFQGFILKFYV